MTSAAVVWPDDPDTFTVNDATYVATAARVAGAGKVSVLDGGFSRWTAEARATTKDRLLSPLAAELQRAGARIFVDHEPEYIAGADLVVRSSAIPDSNVEVKAALAAGIPVIKRRDFLGYLTHGYRIIAIAGTQP